MRESWPCVKDGCSVVCTSHKALHRHVDKHIQEDSPNAVSSSLVRKYHKSRKAIKPYARPTAGRQRLPKSLQQYRRPLVLARGKVNSQSRSSFTNAEMIDLRTPSLSPSPDSTMPSPDSTMPSPDSTMPSPDSTMPSPQLITPQHSSQVSISTNHIDALSPSAAYAGLIPKRTSPTWATQPFETLPTRNATVCPRLGSPIRLSSSSDEAEEEDQTFSMDGDVSDELDFEVGISGRSAAGLVAQEEVDELESTSDDEEMRPSSPLYKLSAGQSERNGLPRPARPMPLSRNAICSSLIDRPITLSPSPSRTFNDSEDAFIRFGGTATTVTRGHTTSGVAATSISGLKEAVAASTESQMTGENQPGMTSDGSFGSSLSRAEADVVSLQTPAGTCDSCQRCARAWKFVADCAAAALAGREHPTAGR